MARLTQRSKTVCLRWRHRIGRGPDQDLVIEHETVSSDHAMIAWTPEGWALRDLGSTNGTWVSGQAVIPGTALPLVRGASIQLGSDPRLWVVDDDGPPEPFAVHGGVTQLAECGLITLATASPAVVFRDWQGGWMLERSGAQSEVRDRQHVKVDDREFLLHLPDALPGTLEMPVGTLETLSLVFDVSEDEERVQLNAQCGVRSWNLGVFERHYTLLTLGRLRAKADGWVTVPELCKMLRVRENALDQHVHRARQQLARLGIVGAASLIERRSGRELRLGVPRARVSIRRT